jgi:hypothetical protein
MAGVMQCCPDFILSGCELLGLVTWFALMHGGGSVLMIQWEVHITCLAAMHGLQHLVSIRYAARFPCGMHSVVLCHVFAGTLPSLRGPQRWGACMVASSSTHTTSGCQQQRTCSQTSRQQLCGRASSLPKRLSSSSDQQHHWVFARTRMLPK